MSTASNDRKRSRQERTSRHDDSDHNETTMQNQELIDSTDSLDSRRKRAHQPGAIVRVKLTNFVTYTDAEFHPGPHLNMVIGPNGTGKSTLVCAICLGLGWGPQLLGRAKDPAEFVKHGCKEAMIEIELQRWTSGPHKTARNPIITRTIKKDSNKSTFTINGHAAPNRKVLELARDTFNIQVDNLCQFLPQDRVVEFAQMNPIQMLESTLQAAADPETLQMHGTLKRLRTEQQELMNNNKHERDQLENLKKRQEGQRVAVERLRERQAVQKKIEQLEKCRPLPRYAEAKKKHQALRRARDALVTEVTQLKEQSRPALNRVNAKQEYRKRAKLNRDNHKKEVDRAQKECDRLEREITRLQESQKECESKIAAEKENATKAKHETARFERQLAELKLQKENVPAEFDTKACNDRIQEHTVKVRQLRQQEEELAGQGRDMRESGERLLARRKELQNRLNALDTQAGQQEERLKDYSRDTYRAWEWIKQNQEQFKHPVFGPVMVECSMKDPDMAAALESLIGKSEMKWITAQCREDFEKLQRVLTREQKLDDIFLRTFRVENQPNFQSPVSEADLERFGLDGWAIDHLQGPPQLINMLCSEKRLHLSAIARRDVSQEQHEMIAASPIQSYVAGNKSTRFVRRAEYGTAGSAANVRDLPRAQIWTNQPTDLGRRAKLQQDLSELTSDIIERKEELGVIVDRRKKIAEEAKQEEAAAKELRDRKSRYQQEQMTWNGLDVKIQAAEDKIAGLNAIVTGVRDRVAGVSAEGDVHMFKKAEVVLKYCGNVTKLKNLHAALLEAEVVLIEAESDAEQLAIMNQHILNTLREKERELQAVEQENERHRTLCTELLAAVKAAMAEAEKLRDEEDDPGLIELMQEFGANKDFTVQELEDLLEVENAKLELHAGGIDAANTIREYEDRVKKMARLESRLMEFREKQTVFVSSISEVRTAFEAAINPVIAKIDAAFAESFARIGCAGQVEVYKASSEAPEDCTEELGGTENGLDFQHWAIHISVKFRENEPLSLLDSHRQSGGERAVSTIFYLMALQSLSRSPFRVVDEINQGMDPRNERMVHGRMVDIATPKDSADDNGSQYFLITPKLLSGLRYERGMTVLCIVSGEYVPSASDTKRRDEDGKIVVERGRKIDFRQLARRARELNSNSNTNSNLDLHANTSRPIAV